MMGGGELPEMSWQILIMMKLHLKGDHSIAVAFTASKGHSASCGIQSNDGKNIKLILPDVFEENSTGQNVKIQK